MQREPDLLAQRLERWKASLVDLTATNPLLVFNPGHNAVRIVRPAAEPLLDRIRDTWEPIRLRLRATASPEQTDVLIAAADRQSIPATLRLLRHRADLARQEQGIHPLFLTFGHLRWQRRGDPRSIGSPLLVLPVSLQRATPFSDYELTLAGTAPDLELNPALRVALRRDYDVDIGTLPVSLRADMLDDALDHVRDAIAVHFDWVVEPAVHLALLPFDRFVMYEDLERNGEAFRNHAVLRALAGEEARIAAPPAPVDPDGEQHHLAISTHVLDADTSQRAAMRAVAGGGSMIIQGPPGTGKSQTITNIIAEALRRERTVLFVSEKRAALDVVARRLEALGLGDAMLALHDDLADERALVRDLGSRTGMSLPDANTPTFGADAERRDEVIAELTELVRQLDAYYTSLCREVPELGCSTFDVVGRLARLRHLPRVRFNYDVASAESFTKERIAAWLRTVEGLASVAEIVIAPESSPWRHVDPSRVSTDPTSRYQLEERLRDLARDADALAGLTGRIARDWGLTPGANRERGRWLAEVLETSASGPRGNVPGAWFDTAVRDRVAALIEESRAPEPGREEVRARIEARYGLALRDRELLDRLEGHLGLGRPGGLRLDPDLVPPGDAGNAPPLGRHARFMLALVRAAAEQVRHASGRLARTLELVPPDCWAAALELEAFVSRSGQEPRPLRAWYDAGDNARLRALAVEAAGRAAILRDRDAFLTRFRPGIFEIATEEAIDNLEEPDDSLWDRLVALVRFDIGRVESHLHEQVALTREDALGALRAAREMRDAEAWFASRDAELRDAFGAHYHGWETRWDDLGALLDHVRRSEIFLDTPGDPPAALTNLSYGVIDVAPQLADLREALALLDSARAGLAAIAPEALQAFLAELETRPLPNLLADITDTWLLGYPDLVADADTLSRIRECPWDTPGEIVRDIHEAGLLADREAELAALLGGFAGNGRPRWADVAGALAWVDGVRSRFAQAVVPPRLVELLAEGRADPAPDGRALREAIERLDEARTRLGPFFEEEPHLTEEAVDLGSLPDLASWATGLLDRLPDLNRFLMARQLGERARDQGIQAFIDAAREERLPASMWRDAFEHQVYTLWMSARLDADPGMLALGVGGADTVRERFEELDRELLSMNARHLAASLAETRRAALEMETLRPDIAALRTAASANSPDTLRSLFTHAPALMQALAPCLLMTPMAVARLLGESPLRFDVVIFDEASQIVPEDAVGAIGRGDQVVVVGDAQQLPPTDFFLADSDSQAWEPESLLELCTVAGLPNTWLQWHYRSRHDDLIAFSNAEFYDDNLVTFPAPSRLDDPVRFERVKDGVYGRGNSRTNPREAEVVVDLLVGHAQHFPDQSAGVIAFSEAQMTAIEDELLRRRATEPLLERFLGEHPEEPLFVRNLENVQGDERDAIFMSVGYGPDRSGSMSLHFGPLNRDGGARRLNVAITRARRQMTIVASFDPDRLADASAEGVKLLRRYLTFARASGEELAQRTESDRARSADPSLVDVIASEIARAGYHAERQVGRGRSRIDIGVKERADSPRYLLGVEVDGSVWETATDPRDRERLRPSVLRGLGWELHRVWSAEWQHDPDRALKRLLDRIEDVARARGLPAPEPPERGPMIDLRGENDEGGFGIDWEAGGAEPPISPDREPATRKPKAKPGSSGEPPEVPPEPSTGTRAEPGAAPEPEPDEIGSPPEPEPTTPPEPAAPASAEPEAPEGAGEPRPSGGGEGAEGLTRRPARRGAGGRKPTERRRALDDIKGLPASARRRLEAAGISSTDDLLRATSTDRAHRALAKQLDVSEGELTDWVNRADLMRVSGIGVQFANLLEGAGVASCRELRHRNPENLLATLRETNARERLVTRLPTLAQVERWIAGADAVIAREPPA